MELEGKILGCYCRPKRCHGNVLIDLLPVVKWWFSLHIEVKKNLIKKHSIDARPFSISPRDIVFIYTEVAKEYDI